MNIFDDFKIYFKGFDPSLEVKNKILLKIKNFYDLCPSNGILMVSIEKNKEYRITLSLNSAGVNIEESEINQEIFNGLYEVLRKSEEVLDIWKRERFKGE